MVGEGGRPIAFFLKASLPKISKKVYIKTRISQMTTLLLRGD
jgi:hypothetical protein